MSKDNDKPGLLHSFLGGLLMTILLVVVVPVVTAWLITPIVNDYFGDVGLGPFTPSMFVTAIMLLVLIVFLLLLGGGKIFKKYGVFGVVGLIVAYYFLTTIWDAILPVAIIIIMVLFSWYRESKK